MSEEPVRCEGARELLSALADESLDPGERAALDEHLSACPGCRRERDRLVALVTALRRLDRPRAPAGFVDRVLAASDPGPWPRRLAAWLFVPLRVKVPLEVAAAALVGLAALWLHDPTDLTEIAGPAPAVQEPAAPAAPATPVPAFRADPSPVSPPRTAPPAPRPAPGAGRARAAAPPPASPPPVTGERPAERSKLSPAAPGAGTSVAPGPVAPLVDAREAPPAASSGPAEVPAPSPGAGPAAAVAKTGAGEGDERRQAAARQESAARGDTAPAPAAPLRLRAPLQARAVRPPDVGGGLVVAAREPAEGALDALLARLGASRLGRRVEAGPPAAVVVELLVPREAYGELADGLARIGRWTPEREPAALPPLVRVEVTLTE